MKSEYIQDIEFSVRKDSHGKGGVVKIWTPEKSKTFRVADIGDPHALELDLAASMQPNEVAYLIDAEPEEIIDLWPAI